MAVIKQMSFGRVAKFSLPTWVDFVGCCWPACGPRGADRPHFARVSTARAADGAGWLPRDVASGVPLSFGLGVHVRWGDACHGDKHDDFRRRCYNLIEQPAAPSNESFASGVTLSGLRDTQHNGAVGRLRTELDIDAPEPRYEVELYADDALDTMKVLRVKPENVSL